MKTMKKAKAPSAKTLARKAKEAAMIAWAKQQHAQFRADLREMFAKEKRERLGMKESIGTGVKTTRLVLQAPGLENKPRLSDLLLGDAEKKADGILTQLRRSREQEVARVKAIAKADAVRREKMKEFEERKKPVPGLGGKTESAVSPAAMRYIDERGTVKGKLGTPVRENTYIPPSVREKVGQAVRTDSPAPTTPQPVSSDYAGGGWYEHRSTKRILWMRGLRSQAGLDRLGIPGKYLGNSATIGDGEYETFYLPDGKSFRRRAETLKPENYTALKQWEDKAKVNDNILVTISFEMINGLYVLVRAMIGAQPKSISGRGLNPQEKFENGMNGFTTLASFIIPTQIPTLKETKQGMNFQEFSKAMKGSYKGQGYARGQQLKIKWHDYKQNELHLELNTSVPQSEMSYAVTLADKIINNKKAD